MTIDLGKLGEQGNAQGFGYLAHLPTTQYPPCSSSCCYYIHGAIMHAPKCHIIRLSQASTRLMTMVIRQTIHGEDVDLRLLQRLSFINAMIRAEARIRL